MAISGENCNGLSQEYPNAIKFGGRISLDMNCEHLEVVT